MLQQMGTQRRPASHAVAVGAPTQLARSHSTGHSLAVRLDRDLERFTLRLPEHLRREIVAAGEHSAIATRAKSWGRSSRGGRTAAAPPSAGRGQMAIASCEDRLREALVLFGVQDDDLLRQGRSVFHVVHEAEREARGRRRCRRRSNYERPP